MGTVSSTRLAPAAGTSWAIAEPLRRNVPGSADWPLTMQSQLLVRLMILPPGASRLATSILGWTRAPSGTAKDTRAADVGARWTTIWGLTTVPSARTMNERLSMLA